jgi:hypothetical protein
LFVSGEASHVERTHGSDGIPAKRRAAQRKPGNGGAAEIGAQKIEPPANQKAHRDGYWSGRVTRESRALDLAAGVFTWKDPKRIAASLKRSAEASHRRKAEPYRSALSMLTFYINRAGKTLPVRQRRTLEMAKVELRKQFGRE